MSPEEYCRNKACKSGSSFYYSFLFLAKDQQTAMIALYAFCREVDDIADGDLTPEVARAKLAWWRDEIAALYAGNPSHPVTRALAPAITAYKLPQALFNEIIHGMAMDLDFQGYATFEDLRLYCHRVASVVGMLSAMIFGPTDEATLAYARHLGLCLQLINIIRDLGEDARMGRIYIPEEDLAHYGIKPQDLLNGEQPPRLAELLAEFATRARANYQQALAKLPPQHRYAQRCGLVMAGVYLALLQEIEADNFQVMAGKTALTPLRKFWLALTTIWHEKRQQKRFLRGKPCPTP